ncbi:MAG: alpha/beta hydrolase [Candidatus Pacebacteria bacterium]|nr:alpha/beta hydrolase [Candidatus Paceibacterota bacterium]
MTVELREKTIEVSGTRTRYRVVGQSEKKVLILHGWAATSYSWRSVSYNLAENGFEAIALDLPGFGETPAPKEVWGTDDYIRFIEDFVKEMGLNKFYLVGHSFGGALALKFAVKNSSSVEKLALCAAVVIRKERLSLRQKISKFLAKHGSRIIDKTPVYPFFEKVAYRIAGAYDYYQASPIMKEIFKKVIVEDMSDLAEKLDKPCLIVWGEHDQAVPLQDAFDLNNLIKNSELKVIRNTGHNPHRGHYEELSRALVNFFEK